VTINITAAEMEAKRRAVNHQIWLQRQVIGQVPPPEMRERLRERLRSEGATDSEIEEAFRQREQCFIRVYLAMNYHRQIRIVCGRLEITGPDAAEHQDHVEPWNTASDGTLSVAAMTWKQLNEKMGVYRQ
tara:strand:+ start:681 stop:1070 length:390 start_codon:yes stop_codon:yes gene_type:complete